MKCGCGRGEFNPENYRSCYECYQDRRAQYVDCIFCGRWHSPKYSSCFQCRAVSDRDDAAKTLRFDILIRDGFCCGACGSYDQPEVDHIQPCAAGGLASPWNLQVLCHACNQAKGSDWDQHRWGATKLKLMRLYLTFGWPLLEPEQQQRLTREALRHKTLHGYAHCVAPDTELPEWMIEAANA